MKKIILTISILFLLVSLLYNNALATDGGVIVIDSKSNNTTNNTSNSIGNKIENKNTNSNVNANNTNKVNNTVNKSNTTNSSYKNTNLPDTGSEDFVIGFVIAAGVISAIYAYIKIRTYNI